MRLILSLALLLAASSAFAADSLRVMTFNVRYPSKADGLDIWENRRDQLVDTIRQADADIVGTQELFQLQGEYIVEKAPEYAWFGLSRRGNHEDEHMGVFYKKDRFEVLDSGNFWLSEKPEEVGSSSWNMSLPRMVTWAVFLDKKYNRRLRYFNTHFPHRREDAEARAHCAQVLADRIRKVPDDDTIVLTGDFNTGLTSEPHKILSTVLKDVRQGVEYPLGPVGTFHGFTGKPGAERIDWIFYRGKLKPESLATITTNREGRYPSDHFPVLAVFNYR